MVALTVSEILIVMSFDSLQEALPPNATHDTVRQQFKQFGPVAYVSLPKYRSGRIKEFAFIEFEQQASVEKCLIAFSQFDGVINRHYQPEKMLSVTSFLKEQLENDAESKDNEPTGADGTTEVEKKATTSATDADGLSECVTDVSDGESLPSVTSQAPPVKRLKLSNAAESENANHDELETVPNVQSEDHPKGEEAEEGPEESGAKRRRRKRRKNRAANGSSVCANEQLIDSGELEAMNTSINVLRVASKTEWKRLRNKYLTIQREQYAQLRKVYAQNSQPLKSSQKASTLPPMPRPVIIKNKPAPSTQICTRNINFYGANDDQSADVPAAVEGAEMEASHERPKKLQKKSSGSLGEHLAKRPLFEYEPGLIVKVSFDGPCVDVSDFKAEIKQYPFVRYVDLKEGQTAAYVRVDSSHSAPLLIKHSAPRSCQILTGDTEADYWKRIARDREEKLSKSIKVPSRNRGRKVKNLLKNLNVIATKGAGNGTHIHFDD